MDKILENKLEELKDTATRMQELKVSIDDKESLLADYRSSLGKMNGLPTVAKAIEDVISKLEDEIAAEKEAYASLGKTL